MVDIQRLIGKTAPAYGLGLLVTSLGACSPQMLNWPDKQSRPPPSYRSTAASRGQPSGPLQYRNGIAGYWHQVRRGDTLYGIAWRNGRDFREVAASNARVYPYTIYPGEELFVPAQRVLVPDRYQPPSERSSSDIRINRTTRQVRSPNGPASRRTARQVPVRSNPSTSRPSRPGPAASLPGAGQRRVAGINWQRPHNGRVINDYGQGLDGRAGLDIAGQEGEIIRAIADGEVVYSGGGLARYGELIIIKHSEDYLSAYAYNRRLLVQEGEKVSAGQKIAEMGEGPEQRPIVHLEIRHKGTPVDAKAYLPPAG